MLQCQCLGWGKVGPVPFGNVKNVHVCAVAKDGLLILYTKGSWESNCKQNGLQRQMSDMNTWRGADEVLSGLESVYPAERYSNSTC